MSPSRFRPRRGFSLPELLISMVMLGIIGVALTRLVVTESRASNRQVLQRSARGVARGALNLMLAELRMAEESSVFSAVLAGNAPAPSGQFLAVNVPWAIGIRCSANEALMLPTDSVIAAIGEQWNRGIGVRDPATGEYDISFNSSVTRHTSYTACATAGINATGLTAMPGMVPYRTTASMGGGVGTPIMFYYQVRYRFQGSTTVPGRRGLFRQVLSATSAAPEEELVAPFADESGFQYYVGTNRMPGPAPTGNALRTVRGVQLNLIGQSEVRASGRVQHETANLSTAVFFRNRL